MQLKRRTLLSGLAASAAVPFMSAAHAKQAGAGTKWDKETDVLVIGYGGAGACAAIEAHDKGSKVLIIEKMAQPGGNTAISSGGFMVPQDGPTALKYLTATYDLANSEKDDELLNTFCKEIMGVKDWMTGLKEGTELWVYGHAGFQNLPGWEVIDKYRVRGKKRSGDCLFDLYRYAVEEKRNIPVMLETPAVQLIQKDGQVCRCSCQE